MRIHPYRDLKRSLRTIGRDPNAWLRWQIVGFGRALFPHNKNNDFRKLTTSILFAVWTLLTLGFNPGIPNETYIAITALVFMILGQQWELEKMRLGPFSATFHNEPPTAPADDHDEDN